MCFRPTVAQKKSIKCPECRKDNPIGTKQCKHCGADIPQPKGPAGPAGPGDKKDPDEGKNNQ